MPTDTRDPYAEIRDFVADVARCPITGGSLSPMTDEQVSRAREMQSEGTLLHPGGAPVERPFEAGVVTADGRLAYQLSEGILVLLVDLAVALDESAASETPDNRLGADKQAVRTFYDEVGWTTNPEGVHDDTERFVDTRPEAKEYYWRSASRVERHLGSEGKYFLDVASGPVRFPDYPARASAFEKRVCVDMSVLALRGARQRVGDRGIYVQGDITNLPFKDDSIDSGMSMATIYHVPKDEQATAFRELHRVLKPGASAVVSYAWGSVPWRDLPPGRRLLHLPARVARRLSRARPAAPPSGVEHREAGLYFHAYDYHWFVNQPWPFEYEVTVGRLLTTEFMKRFIHERLRGRRILELVVRAEDRFPRLAGRFGRHPLIVIRKAAARGAAPG